VAGSITQYVIKVHSRCNLACDHCYVYEQADQTWRQRPAVITPRLVDLAGQRIAEHAADHGLPMVHVVLHGGEPLLIGRERMRAVLTALDSRITPVTRLDIRVHTNGVLLDEQWGELFSEYGVKIGISLDGDRSANDRHRRFLDGRTSYPQVRRALELLRRAEFRPLYAGILCTIDLDNDPVAAYEALMAESPPQVDFLLPHATWENPPALPAGLAEPYAAWLLRIYRRWVSDGRPVPIRLFDSLASAARGGPSWSEAVGLDPADLLVIETDGAWEQSDSLKTAYHGAASTGLHVAGNAVDEVARQPAIAARQGGLRALSATCRACSVAAICGGGLYAHRYRAGSGFDNPSVYCADLKVLIKGVTGVGPSPAGRRPPRAAHEVSAAALDALAAGPGDPSTVLALAQAQQSFTRALVASVAAMDGWTNKEHQRSAAEGWTLLGALDADYPAAVSEVFSHPYVRAWAVGCLRSPRGDDRDLDRAHLASLAAAAALRAGTEAELTVPVRDGTAYLPTAGAIRVGSGPGATTAVKVAHGRVVARGESVTWQETRQVTGPGLRVQVEDLDPFRDCYEHPVTGRLAASEWRAWQRDLGEASARLSAAVPAYAAALEAGLRSIVPLRGGQPGRRSATARQAFGGVAAALPGGQGGLDELLLHEFQHVKLNGVLDMVDLLDRADQRRLPVPWRTDLRPLTGVLHGAYAHLALVHLARSGAQPHRARFLQYQSWVCATAETLLVTGSLTSEGERFVAGLHAAAQASPDER
jgi:uncharacterized protein